MVSTTLTTIATGKTTSGINNLHSSTTTSSTSPENYITIETANRAHYQPRSNSLTSSSQQQHVSSLASPTTTTATTRNSFYYSRTHTNEGKTTINGNDNLNDSTEFNHNTKYYQREQIQQQQQQQQQLLREQQQQQKYLNGKTTNGETAKHETTTTIPTTTTAVNLSQALLSPSPPIKDQISLLFPKCRPKTANNNSSLESSPTDGNSNVAREDHSITSNSNLKLNHKLQNGELENQDTLQQQQQQQQEKQNTNNHYYRSVNIITQSPPPHSVSSISSESLSSVTPRISTNPFLCSTLLTTEETEDSTKRREIEEQKRVQQQSIDDNRKVSDIQDEEEELPVPNYAPFYYHTSTTSPPTKDLRKQNEDLRERHNTSSPIAKEQQQQQRKHNEEQPRDRTINEMPRKRSQYERYHHIQAVNGQNYSRDEKPYNHLNHAEILNAVQQHQRNVEMQQQQQQQHHHSQQNGHQSTNQNPFVKDNYWETRQNTTPTSTVLNSPDYSSNNGSIEIETRSHNRRSIYQQPDQHVVNNTQQQQHQTQPQQQQQQPAYVGRQQPPVTSHHIRLGRSPNNEVAYQETTNNIPTTTTANTTQKRNNYNAQQQQQQQHSLHKSNPCSEGLTPLAAQYLYGSKTSLHESTLNHQNDWPDKRDLNHERSERCLARERDRERELREQRSKTINAERYINAALVRESVGEQTTTNNSMEIRDRRDRERHSYSAQQQHHHLSQKYQQQQQHKSSQQQYQHHSQKSHHQQQQQQLQQQHHQQAHNQSQRQLNDERLNSNNDVIFDDMTESWQNLRVTTDSSSQINNTRSLVSDTTKSHIDSSSTSTSAVNSVSKKSHLLTTDIKDDKHIVTVGSGGSISCDIVETSSFKEHHSKYLEKNHTINVETRHGIIEYEGSPRRIGQMGNTNDEEHIARVNNKLSQNLTTTTATAVTATKTNHHNALAMTSTAGAITTTATNATTNSPKQQQHYTARPGFPQRIISPQRESTPPIMLLNYNSKQQQQQQQQQLQHQQQQQLNSQTLPQQSPTADNNGEDTSNDVSEIGTISDLTTPEAISTANNLLVTSSGGGNGMREHAPTPPPIDKDIDIMGIERGATTTTSSLTTSCTTPTTTAAIAAVIAAATANASSTAAAASTTMTPLNITNASSMAATTAATIMNSSNPLSIPTKSSTFDYLYEFSETRKVLEEFFKCPSNDDKPIIENSSDVDSIDIQYEFHTNLGRDIEEDEADGDAEVDDDEDDIQLDVENEEDEEDDDEDNNDETPQHHQHSQQQQHQQQLQHPQQLQHHTPLQTTNNHHHNQHHTHQQNNYHSQQQQHHVNYRNHLQSPTQFTYRPYNENGDGGEDDIDDVDINHHDILDINEHDDSKLHRHQQDGSDGGGGGSGIDGGSIIGLDEHNHHNFSLMNNRHNARHHNARRHFTGSPLMRDFDFFLDSASRSSCEQIDQQIDGINHNQMNTNSRQNYRYSPETTDYDSNCGDLDSLSGELNGGVSTSCSNYAAKFYAASAMPILEDGLSSGHTSDTENNNQNNILNQQNSAIHHTPIGGGISMLMDMKRVSTNNSINSMNNTTISTNDMTSVEKLNSMSNNIIHDSSSSYMRKTESPINGLMEDSGRESVRSKPEMRDTRERELIGQSPQSALSNNKVFKNIDPDLDSLYSISVFHRNDMVQMTPPPPAPAPHRKPNVLSAEPDILQPTPYRDMTRTGTNNSNSPTKVSTTTNLTSTSNSSSSGGGLQTNTSPKQAQNIKRTAQPQQPPPLPERNIVQRSPSPVMNSPVWLSRHLDVSASNKGLLESSSENHSKNLSADEDDVDTDLETDRLLGHQRLDDQGYYDENKSWDRKPARSLLSKISPKQVPSTKTRNGYNALLSSTPEIPPPIPPKNSSNKLLDIGGSLSSSEHSDKSPIKSIDIQDCGLTLGSPGGSEGSGCLKKEIDNGIGPTSGNSSTASGNGVNSATGNTGGNGSSIGSGSGSTTGEKKVKKSKNKEGGAVLIEGVLFRAKYLGSTQLVCEGQPTKSTRMMQAEEAVSRIKALAPDGDVQPSTEVDLFISTEKIMVLNTDLKEIMMDHALRTISYIADIGDLVVLMARRRFVPQDIDDAPKPNRTPKMICHVFESDEAQFIAQSIGQAFQVAYMEFLKANGIEDHRFVKEMDYQEVLNSQEIFGDELEIFAKKELQKEVVVPKAKGEILGVVIVESGWGSMLPTVVIANLMSTGAAARCGQLNIGDQLIAINGLSLVGLPLSTCQNYIKNTKNQTVVKFTVVPCPPVVEVKIKRPETKYQLGFSVQNGVICSLLRGGIAERGGVRVGHRIIEINNQSVVAVPHEKIVNLLATSVGEILMKTMPTSMFRLLTGQENPIYI